MSLLNWSLKRGTDPEISFDEAQVSRCQLNRVNQGTDKLLITFAGGRSASVRDFHYG